MNPYFQKINMPKHLSQTIKDFVQEHDINWFVDQKQDKSRRFMVYTFPHDHDVYQMFGFDLGRENIMDIELLFSRPNPDIYSIHTDKKRRMLLNFPIQVDHDNSNVIIGKTPDVEDYKYQKNFISLTHRGALKFPFEEDKYDLETLDKATIMNAWVPHGWTNYSDDWRIICSIGFQINMTQEEVMNLIPEEWK